MSAKKYDFAMKYDFKWNFTIKPQEGSSEIAQFDYFLHYFHLMNTLILSLLFERSPANWLTYFEVALSGLRQFLVTESPLNMMKNAFYFTSKALFVLKIFKFCIDFLVMYRNGFIKKIRLILNFTTSQPG